MIVSIVTGTYNRLTYLRNMVQSVRKSIGFGITYEIVVVDGGSTDDTIPWCMNQPDIKLILHGELRGAVKAFNDGARAAIGKYVILANDDIEFMDDSITHAIRYMEDHRRCGVGCFYQDRDGKAFHVEMFPAVLNGKQVSRYYGQVCIVPRHLGDDVGWWGDYLHTYGGDNELSSHVLEAGYTVDPIRCACVHDMKADDKLRQLNIGDPRTMLKHGVMHPDTKLWYERWTRNGLVGPVIPHTTPDVERTRLYRYLYLPIYEIGHPIQKKQKRGLRDALASNGIVVEIDYVYEVAERGVKYLLDYVYDMMSALNPDIVLFQLQDANTLSANDIYSLREEFPNATFVNWNGDYHPENLNDRDYIALLRQFDLCGVVTTEVAGVYDKKGIKWKYWQIGWEGEELEYTSDAPSHDIVFLGNAYSSGRHRLGHALRQLPYNVGLYGSWPAEFRPNGMTLYDFDTGYKLYKNAKIAIGDSQWPHATGFVSNRLFQAMYSGVLMFHQWFDGCEELLGLKDGIHLVLWRDIDDLIMKLDFHLSGDPEVEELNAQIAHRGYHAVKNQHSFDVRVAEMHAMLKDQAK